MRERARGTRAMVVVRATSTAVRERSRRMRTVRASGAAVAETTSSVMMMMVRAVRVVSTGVSGRRAGERGLGCILLNRLVVGLLALHERGGRSTWEGERTRSRRRGTRESGETSWWSTAREGERASARGWWAVVVMRAWWAWEERNTSSRRERK